MGACPYCGGGGKILGWTRFSERGKAITISSEMKPCEKCNGTGFYGWDLFDLLSSAWYGKGCYFRQEDGTVYSRMSGEYLSFDQAVDEFARRLAAIEEVE